MKSSLLLVEDDDRALWAMEEFFRARGFDVAGARTLGSAEDALAAKRFDLVITDLRLSEDEDGLVVIASARRRTPPSQVILLTAHGYPELFAIARHLGAAHVLDKPQSLVELLRLAQELVGDEPARGRRAA